MNTGRISIRYARAAYEYAAENSEEERLYHEMITLEEQFAAFPSLSRVMKDPTVSSAEKIKLLETAAGIEVSDSFRKVVLLIVGHHREEVVRLIALMYQDYYRQSKGLTIARLTLPDKAAEGLAEKIQALLSTQTKKQVELEIRTDESIIGGFVLQVESSRLDASVKRSLTRLRRKFAEANKDNIA